MEFLEINWTLSKSCMLLDSNLLSSLMHSTYLLKYRSTAEAQEAQVLCVMFGAFVGWITTVWKKMNVTV